MADTSFYRVRFMLDSGAAGECPAIEHDGALWLVPAWISFPAEGYTKPTRMIPLAQFQPKALGPRDLAIDGQLPNTLFADSRLSPSMIQQYGVREQPDIKFRTGGTRH